MKRNRKQNIKLLALALILLLGIGFAAIATQLKIEGTLDVAKTSWDVHLENVSITPGSVTANPAPTTDEVNKNTTEIAYSMSFNKPGDFYEFTVDMVNSGTIDAMVDSVSNLLYENNGTTLKTLPAYLESTVTYADGITIEQNHYLKKNTTEKIKVRVEFKKDINISDLPSSSSDTMKFIFKADYKQADNNARKIDRIAVGEYISLVPDVQTYSVPATLTGYDSDQTINPSELNLWRVIDIHSDGSFDAVSEYVSSTKVYFPGTAGYANFVGTLNTIASQYQKSGYTIGAREMGYDGQTSIIGDTSAFDGTTNTAPSETDTPSPTSGTGQEYSGGVLGDTLYLKDYTLVSNVYKSDTTTYGSSGLKAYKVGTTTATGYWIASRFFGYFGETLFYFSGRYVYTNGSLGKYDCLRSFDNGWNDLTFSYAIRPILTLKSGITISGGSGSKDNPYTLG